MNKKYNIKIKDKTFSLSKDEFMGVEYQVMLGRKKMDIESVKGNEQYYSGLKKMMENDKNIKR